MTTGTWNVAPFFTGPGEVRIRPTEPGAAGALVGSEAGAGAAVGAVGGGVTLRLGWGTVFAAPPAAAFICAMAAGAAVAALWPGTVPAFESVGAIEWVTTGWTCAGLFAPGPSAAIR